MRRELEYITMHKVIKRASLEHLTKRWNQETLRKEI